MPLLFRLRYVPDDEASEVRSLLNENSVPFRETSGGFLGLGTAALWVDGENEFNAATELLNHYQEQRLYHAQAQQVEDKQHGRHETLWSNFRQQPVQFLVYFIIACGIIYLSVKPFFGFK